MAKQPQEVEPDYLPWSKYKDQAWKLLLGESKEIPQAPSIDDFNEMIAYFAPLLEILIFGMQKDPLEAIEELLIEYKSGVTNSWQVKWWGPALEDIHAWLVSESDYFRGVYEIHSDYKPKLAIGRGMYAEVLNGQGARDTFHLKDHSLDRRKLYSSKKIVKKAKQKNVKSNAVDADVVFTKYLKSNFDKPLESLKDDDIANLILKFGIWMSTDSYKNAPWIARYAIRTVRPRIDNRFPGEKRDLWGTPSVEGYFTDDNSLIKSSYKNMRVVGRNNPYGESFITSGLVCCHVWPHTTKDAQLFSFIPNLIWIPKSLSRYTDVIGNKPIHKIHYILQNCSISRFKSVKVRTGSDDANVAWSKLNPNNITMPSEIDFAEFVSEPKLSALVQKRHNNLIDFLKASLSNPPYKQVRFSARYHLGFGAGINKSVPKIVDLVDSQKIKELLEVIQKTKPNIESED